MTEQPNLYDRHGNYVEPRRVSGSVGRSYPASRPTNPPAPAEERLDDVRDPDPFAEVVGGAALLVLVGGFVFCAAWALGTAGVVIFAVAATAGVLAIWPRETRS